MRIGVDVGGTNTDAVLMDGCDVLAIHKAPTSKNVTDGIVAALIRVLENSGFSPNSIQSVMIGTTHFTNAIVERRGLLEVGVLRLSLPASSGLPPMIDWPEDLVQITGRHHYMVGGGYEVDGRPIAPLDETAVADAAHEMRRKGLRSVVISGVFSPVNPAMENRAAEIVASVLPEAAITLSSTIGRIGLLERENAAIMNASLLNLSVQFVAAIRAALNRLNIVTPFYVCQNDGTLMNAAFVERYPVLTFSSGPTNSMRGAAYLSGLKDALVMDIGGTTTDIGKLVNGFPRESSVSVDIGGVRTNFRMPDIVAFGLGGGSLVNQNEHLTVGPSSVGYRLTEQALVFGGKNLTATDIAVAARYADIGDWTRVSHLSKTMIDEAVEKMHNLVEMHIDRVKTSAADIPLVLVGGGSILINKKLAGVSEQLIPEHAEVANAIGASIAQVGGESDKVYNYETQGREVSIEEAKALAVQMAVDAGADAKTVELIDFDEVPLVYVPGNAVRVRVKVAGNLASDK